MKHEDGVEVYLRPHNSKRQHGGYPETELPLADDRGGFPKRCAIDHRKRKVELTLELLPTFDMHGASALHIGFCPIPPPRRRRSAFWSGRVHYSVRHANEVGKGPTRILTCGATGMAAFNMRPISKKGIEGLQ